MINGKHVSMVFVSTVAATTTLVIWLWGYNEPLPPPVFVSIPEFQGKILAREQVKFGVPAIQIDRPFKEVGSWGKDGILVYEILDHHQNTLALEAWRADPASNGVFECAKTSFHMNWKDWIFSVNDVKFCKNGIVVLTAKKDFRNQTFILGGVFLCSLISLGIFLAKAIKAYYRPYAKLSSN